MKVTVIPTVGDVLGMVSKGLERRLDEFENWGRIETIQITALLISERILKPEIWGELLSLSFLYKTNN